MIRARQGIGTQGIQGIQGGIGIPGDILLASQYDKDAVEGILISSQYNP